MSKQSKHQDQEQIFEDKLVDVTYVDFNKKLSIPEDVLIWQAQKYQVVIEKMEQLLKSSPQQFSAKEYREALNEYVRLVEQLKKRGENSDGDRVAADVSRYENEAEVGDRAPAGVGAGVSAQNPFAR